MKKISNIYKSSFVAGLILAFGVSQIIDSHAADSKTPGAEEHQEPAGVGPDKAITEATVNDGIRVSEKAISVMSIKTEGIQLQKESFFKIPAKSLLYFQSDTGVYRLRDGWFKLITGKITNKTTTDAVFESKDLKAGDQVVVEGGQLLRLGELNIWGGGGDAD